MNIRKYYNGSVKKSKFSFSCHLQMDKKINNVKEDLRRKIHLVHIIVLFLLQKRLK